MEEFKELRALVSVDTKLFGLSRVVPLARTAGCYRFPFTVPAVSQTSGGPIVKGGDSPPWSSVLGCCRLPFRACGVFRCRAVHSLGRRFPWTPSRGVADPQFPVWCTSGARSVTESRWSSVLCGVILPRGEDLRPMIPYEM